MIASIPGKTSRPTRKSFYKAAIAELLGYLRGYDSAAQFRAIGCNTWNANANENGAWLGNPARKGEDDMGRVYGVQGRQWMASDGSVTDQLKKIVDNLSKSPKCPIIPLSFAESLYFSKNSSAPEKAT